MITGSVMVQLPDNTVLTLKHPTSPTLSLADWLDHNRCSLNTRCGGRGLCRGCEVETTSGTVKACQVKASAVQGTVRIPQTSLGDRGLCGVSDFDLQIPKRARPRTERDLALAVDLGTTTLAAALWDTAAKRCLATASVANPQRRFGDDVLSRISFSLEHPDGLQRLQHALIDEGLPQLMRELDPTSAHLAAVRRLCFVGNPTLLHILCGLSLEGLSRYPFRAATTDPQSIPPLNAAIPLPAKPKCDLLPALGPFVGADVVAGVLASGMMDTSGTNLLLDFGTNGEMILCHDKLWWATATAAGPAFEGGRLRCGRAAHKDTISSLALSADGAWLCLGPKNKELRSAKGISGAAYIDFLALATEAGLLSPLGRIHRTHPLWTRHGSVLAGEAIIYLDAVNYISEADIAELLQAKAATGAGITTLLQQAKLESHDLDRVFIAGGFGYHLHPAHARSIGLLPNVPLHRMITIGNAALAGASLALQYHLTDYLQELTTTCSCIELNKAQGFADTYSDCLCIEPL